jgi:hypothetical protein
MKKKIASWQKHSNYLNWFSRSKIFQTASKKNGKIGMKWLIGFWGWVVTCNVGHYLIVKVVFYGYWNCVQIDYSFPPSLKHQLTKWRSSVAYTPKKHSQNQWILRGKWNLFKTKITKLKILLKIESYKKYPFSYFFIWKNFFWQNDNHRNRAVKKISILFCYQWNFYTKIIRKTGKMDRKWNCYSYDSFVNVVNMNVSLPPSYY